MVNLEEERITLQAMVRIYCRSQHAGRELCQDCAELLEYASARLDRCPFGTQKPTCQGCPVHCYKPEMRQRVQDVMRFSGPRMIWHHPRLAIRHLLHSRRSSS